MRYRCLASVMGLCWLFSSAIPAVAQEPTDSVKKQIEELKKELYQIKLELADLRNLQATPQEGQGDELERFEERLEKRLRELENKIDAISRATAPIVFNPRTTTFINFAARADDK